MKRLVQYIFSPPSESGVWRKLLPYLVVPSVFILPVLLIAPPVWEYTNSTSFCGTTCHTMPPEYNTFLVSPHARVACVDCHIGRDLLIVQAYRKAGHMRLLFDTVLDNYEYPIRTSEMRPARETCELCHFPEKFSDDSLRVLHRFEDDRENSAYAIYLLMHTGGGSQREGLGQGIHWHVENKVSYIATDDLEQEIPWVRVEKADGTIEEYNAINSPIDTANLEQYEMHEMDCITCHNRISHLVDNPRNLVDTGLYRGELSADIPFIRSRALEMLSIPYGSVEQARENFATLDEYYADYYPDFYAEGQGLVQDAVMFLNTQYEVNNFPEQELNWTTHPNNVGHRDWPGCFRCHDGEHFSEDGTAIRLECNLCHSIPQIVRPGEIEPSIPLTTGLEPASHLQTTWISQHHEAFDATCANCHTTSNPGGADDSSFCANSGCHGTEWKFAGFDAPGLAMTLDNFQVEAPPLLEDFDGAPTYAVLQPLFVQQCGGCHGPVPSKGLKLIEYATAMAGGEDGPVIIPGDAEGSLIVQTLEGGHFARLTDHQMDLLKTWINNNAPEE